MHKNIPTQTLKDIKDDSKKISRYLENILQAQKSSRLEIDPLALQLHKEQIIRHLKVANGDLLLSFALFK